MNKYDILILGSTSFLNNRIKIKNADENYTEFKI